jgi:Tol biopolymer transport system component
MWAAGVQPHAAQMSTNRHPIRVLTLAGAAGLCLAFSSGALAAPEGSTTLLSRPAGLTALPAGLVNNSSVDGAVSSFYGSATNVSADGRLVAFTSSSDGMSSEDDDSTANVYVKDTVSGEVTLISRASGPVGEPADTYSRDPSISSDGTAVAFTTSAALDPADVNETSDVYVRYLDSDVTALVSRADGADGAVGDGVSESPSISGDGNLVAFESASTNLGDGDTTATDDVHVRDVAGGHTILASRQTGSNGAIGNAPSTEPALSADGTRVAFRSVATNLDTVYDTNGFADVYRRDLLTNATVLVSRPNGQGTPAGNGESGAPAIDSDGSHVAFETRASNLHSADPNPASDVHVRALFPGTTVPVSRADGTGGAIGSAPSRGPAISADGGSVAFTTSATNLGDGDTDTGNDIHVRRVAAGDTLLASRQSGSAGSGADGYAEIASISGDGSHVAFRTGAGNLSSLDDDDFQQVFVRELNGLQRLTHVSRPSGVDGAVIGGVNVSSAPSSSADGRYVAFSSKSDTLLDSRPQQVFVKDTATGELTLVSRADGPNGAPANGTAERPRISADGSRVIFVASATNLVAGVSNSAPHAYVRDLEAGTTELVSRNPDGTIPAFANVFQVDLSGDGRVAAFNTYLPLVPGDTGNDYDVYVRDLETGTVDLANRVDGAAGGEGNGRSESPSLDHDGDRVAFTSFASNLGNGDPDADEDIHVRDLSTGRTLYASRADGANGDPADDSSANASISADGTRVAFTSGAANLGDGDSDGVNHTHVRDLASGRTLLGSANAAGAPTTGSGHFSAALSADGRRVVFGTHDALDPADDNGLMDIYQRDLDSGAVTRVSRGDGSEGATAEGSSPEADPDADGSCVAFSSSASNLVLGGYASSDFLQVYQRCGGFGASAGGDGGDGGEGGDGGGGGEPKPEPDATAPVVSRFLATRSRFRVARQATALTAAARRVRAGTTLRYRLSEAARVAVKVERQLPGRRTKGRCVKPAPRLQARPRCTRVVPAGTLVRSGRAGANAVRFSGRLGKRALAAGRYRVTLVATDAAGNRSRPARLVLRIIG